MSERDISNISIGGLVKFHPEDFVDSPDGGIKMGEAPPFSDDPIEEVKEIPNRMPTSERWGFTPRYYTHACSDSPEVKALKEKIWKKGK